MGQETVVRWSIEKQILDDPDLRTSETCLLLVMLTYTNSRSGEGFPSNAKLASDMNVTVRAVQMLKQNLKKKGWLHESERFESNGRQTSNLIRIGKETNESSRSDTPEQEPDANVASGVKQASGGRVKQASGGRVKHSSPLEPRIRNQTDSADAESAHERDREQAAVDWWLSKLSTHPGTKVVGKNRKILRRIVEEHGWDEVRVAVVGIERVYPYSKGTQWDFMDLEKHWVKAIEAGLGSVGASKRQHTAREEIDELFYQERGET